jgi:hypothetical protein
MRGLDSGDLGFLLGNTLGKESIVFGLLLFLVLDPAFLKRTQVATALKTLRGDQSLNLGSLGVRLRVLLLRALDLSPDHVLPHIILLAQVEEPPDLRRPLGTQSLGKDGVGQSGDVVITLLDDDEGENGDIGANDASTDGFALALTSTARAVARVALGEEKTDTVGEKDTLLHGETLLVVSTGDAEDVALVLVTERVSSDFVRHLLLEEGTVFSLIFDVNELLGPSCGVGDVELHVIHKVKKNLSTSTTTAAKERLVLRMGVGTRLGYNQYDGWAMRSQLRGGRCPL